MPRIVYLDQVLSPRDIPGLYTACDCLVHPYRGEGFGLPIAEAMACGLPVVVTNYGAALDFCDSETAYLVPALVRQLPERRIGDMDTVDHPWLAEPDADALAHLMRHIYEHPDKARALGLRASQRIRSAFTWERAAALALERIEAIRWRPVRRRLSAAAPSKEGCEERPITLVARRGTHLLMMPDWNEPQDGWRVTLREFFREFRPDEDVGLIVRLDPLEFPRQDEVVGGIHRWARAEGIDLAAGPMILLLNDRLEPSRRDCVYGTAHILVDPGATPRAQEIRRRAAERGLVRCAPNGRAMREALDAVTVARRSGSTAVTARGGPERRHGGGHRSEGGSSASDTAENGNRVPCGPPRAGGK